MPELEPKVPVPAPPPAPAGPPPPTPPAPLDPSKIDRTPPTFDETLDTAIREGRMDEETAAKHREQYARDPESYAPNPADPAYLETFDPKSAQDRLLVDARIREGTGDLYPVTDPRTGKTRVYASSEMAQKGVARVIRISGGQYLTDPDSGKVYQFISGSEQAKQRIQEGWRASTKEELEGPEPEPIVSVVGPPAPVWQAPPQPGFQYLVNPATNIVEAFPTGSQEARSKIEAGWEAPGLPPAKKPAPQLTEAAAMLQLYRVKDGEGYNLVAAISGGVSPEYLKSVGFKDEDISAAGIAASNVAMLERFRSGEGYNLPAALGAGVSPEFLAQMGFDPDAVAAAQEFRRTQGALSTIGQQWQVTDPRTGKIKTFRSKDAADRWILQQAVPYQPSVAQVREEGVEPSEPTFVRPPAEPSEPTFAPPIESRTIESRTGERIWTTEYEKLTPSMQVVFFEGGIAGLEQHQADVEARRQQVLTPYAVYEEPMGIAGPVGYDIARFTQEQINQGMSPESVKQGLVELGFEASVADAAVVYAVSSPEQRFATLIKNNPSLIGARFAGVDSVGNLMYYPPPEIGAKKEYWYRGQMITAAERDTIIQEHPTAANEISRIAEGFPHSLIRAAGKAFLEGGLLAQPARHPDGTPVTKAEWAEMSPEQQKQAMSRGLLEWRPVIFAGAGPARGRLSKAERKQLSALYKAFDKVGAEQAAKMAERPTGIARLQRIAPLQKRQLQLKERPKIEGLEDLSTKPKVDIQAFLDRTFAEAAKAKVAEQAIARDYEALSAYLANQTDELVALLRATQALPSEAEMRAEERVEAARGAAMREAASVKQKAEQMAVSAEVAALQIVDPVLAQVVKQELQVAAQAGTGRALEQAVERVQQLITQSKTALATQAIVQMQIAPLTTLQTAVSTAAQTETALATALKTAVATETATQPTIQTQVATRMRVAPALATLTAVKPAVATQIVGLPETATAIQPATALRTTTAIQPTIALRTVTQPRTIPITPVTPVSAVTLRIPVTPRIPIAPRIPPKGPPKKPPKLPRIRLVAASPAGQLIPEGSIAWKQGELSSGKSRVGNRPVWKFIPPPYTDLKPQTIMAPPHGAVNIHGKTPEETLQVIGSSRTVPRRVDVDLGWTDIIIRNGREIVFRSGGERTNVGTAIESNVEGMTVEGTEVFLEEGGRLLGTPPEPEGISRPAMSRKKPKRSRRDDDLSDLFSLKGIRW